MGLMVKIAYYFLLSFVLISSIIFCWHKMLGKVVNFKDKRLYISLFSLMIISLQNYFNVNAYIRIVTITILLIIFFRFLFRDDLKKTIITPIFVQLIYMISEMMFVVIICSMLGIGNVGVIDSFFGTLLSNVCISCISIILVYIPFIRKMYSAILLLTNKISNKLLIVLSFIFIIIANLLVAILYYKIDFKYLLIFNTLITVFCFSIVIYTLKTKNNHIKILQKYNTTLNSLKEYEEILDRYRISNHENKNQLLTIRNLIPKSNDKILSYIDTVIENKQKDDDKTILETSKIPAGGLRGLIYSKILLMKELKINYNLEISKEVRIVDLINCIDDLSMLDICKIIGVYIDNSIQAVKDLKEKYINIEMYIEEKNLLISISNNYSGKINESKLDLIGYTTKGKNHGYGLYLVKEIINKNTKLSSERRVTKEIFSQILKIKM